MAAPCDDRILLSRGLTRLRLSRMKMTLYTRTDVSVVHSLTDYEIDMKKLPGKRRRAAVLRLLKQGSCPRQILQNVQGGDPVQFWAVVDYLKARDRTEDALQVFQWWKNQAGYRAKEHYYTPFIHILRKARMPFQAQNLFNEMRDEGIQPSLATMATLMLCYAESGFPDQAQILWNEISNCGFQPDTVICMELMDAYGKMGFFNEIARIFEEIKSRGHILDAKIYTTMISCYGKGGQLQLMENIFEEMRSGGFSVDSSTVNLIVRSYSFAGSLTGMEESYRCLKAYRYFLEEETIREMAFAYIQKERFYQLGEFVRKVGLKRKNVGNLLWNLLLLSYAANFKMRNLQREFLNMVDAGFKPDLTTFNIRALAFSRMEMFWDLHVSVLHMQHMNIAPDIVTFGAIVDSYLNGKMANKLSLALSQIGMHNLYPNVLTDPLVYEAFGKGDFHVSAENLLQYPHKKHREKWTYSKLLRFYLKKHFRKGQLFWNH